MKYVKIPIFFRTRDEYKLADSYANRISDYAESKHGMTTRPLGPQYVTIQSAAVTVAMGRIMRNIPKSRPGKKKYMATIGIAEQLYADARKDMDFEKDLTELGLEIVPKGQNKPKYKEEDITRETIRLKTAKHFKKVTSELNREYGHGNWHIRGARKIYHKLTAADYAREGGVPPFSPDREMIEKIVANGLKVDIIVTDKVDNLQQLLFKIELSV